MANVFGKFILGPVVCVVAGMILFLIWPLGDVITGQTTTYPVLRQEGELPLPLNRSVYKALTNSQTVIHWMPGIDEVPMKLAKCTVRDRSHWRCEYPDGSAVLTMQGGRLNESQNPHLGPGGEVVHVSRLRWWALSLGLFNGGIME